MQKTNSDTNYYDLSLSQRVVYLQFKYSFFKEVMNIAVCFYLKQKLDYELLKKSFNIEIERNDALRLFYKKDHEKIMQYFNAPYVVDKIDQIDFTGKSKTDQDTFLKKDASKPVCFLKDEIFRIKLIKTYDGGTGIYFAVCHMNMDVMSVFLFFNDLIKVYTSLRDNTEMPKPFSSFIDYMEREKKYMENTEKIAKDEQYFRDLFMTGGEPTYLGANGTEPLESLRRKSNNPNLRSFPTVNPFQSKTNNIKLHLDAELSKQIDRFCTNYNIAAFNIIQFAMRTYLSKINNGIEDIIYMVLCNKRATLADKNTSGCLVDGVLVRTNIGSDTKFNDAVNMTGEALSNSFRHVNYDSFRCIALLNSMYKKPLLNSHTSMMLTYLPVITPEGWDVDADWISNGRFATHLYIIIVNNPNNGGYDIYYEYRVKILNENNIKALHNGMSEIIKLGLANPEMNIGELIK